MFWGCGTAEWRRGGICSFSEGKGQRNPVGTVGSCVAELGAPGPVPVVAGARQPRDVARAGAVLWPGQLVQRGSPSQGQKVPQASPFLPPSTRQGRTRSAAICTCWSCCSHYSPAWVGQGQVGVPSSRAGEGAGGCGSKVWGTGWAKGLWVGSEGHQNGLAWCGTVSWE